MLRQAMGTAIQVGQRALAGESLAFQHFTSTGGEGTVGFAGVLPGEMRALELDGGRAWFVEKSAFVAAESTVELAIAFQGGRTGRSGGEGLAWFGTELVDAALAAGGRKLIVVEVREVDDDLVRDMAEVFTSFGARLYGRRSARNRARRALEAVE
ncbi:MAG: hypothetical protein HOY75_26140 [Streptomyces sp.]|nr:hypothetical protein [Streptomyces sp.]